MMINSSNPVKSTIKYVEETQQHSSPNYLAVYQPSTAPGIFELGEELNNASHKSLLLLESQQNLLLANQPNPTGDVKGGGGRYSHQRVPSNQLLHMSDHDYQTLRGLSLQQNPVSRGATTNTADFPKEGDEQDDSHGGRLMDSSGKGGASSSSLSEIELEVQRIREETLRRQQKQIESQIQELTYQQYLVRNELTRVSGSSTNHAQSAGIYSSNTAAVRWGSQHGQYNSNGPDVALQTSMTVHAAAPNNISMNSKTLSEFSSSNRSSSVGGLTLLQQQVAPIPQHPPDQPSFSSSSGMIRLLPPPLNLQKVHALEGVHTDSRINRMKNLLLEAKRKIEGPLISPKIDHEQSQQDGYTIRTETERLKSQRQSQCSSRNGGGGGVTQTKSAVTSQASRKHKQQKSLDASPPQVGFDSEVLEQWKQDIERVRDSLKRLQEERVGLKRPESLEKFQQLQQENDRNDTIKPYMSQTREPAVGTSEMPRKQLRFDTDDVYLAYLGKSNPREEVPKVRQSNQNQQPQQDTDIQRRVKEAKVNLEWKIALRMKQRQQAEGQGQVQQKPPSTVVTLRKSPPKDADEKSPYRRPPGVPSHIVSPPKSKVRTSVVGFASTDSQNGKRDWNFSTRSEAEMLRDQIRQVKSPTTAASSDHGTQNNEDKGVPSLSRNFVKLQKSSLPTQGSGYRERDFKAGIISPKTPMKGSNQSKELLGTTSNSSIAQIGGTAQKTRPIKLIQRIHKAINDECATPNQGPSSQVTKKLSVVKLIRPPTAQQKSANDNPILSVSPRAISRSDKKTQRQASVPASIKSREQSLGKNSAATEGGSKKRPFIVSTGVKGRDDKPQSRNANSNVLAQAQSQGQKYVIRSFNRAAVQSPSHQKSVSTERCNPAHFKSVQLPSSTVAKGGPMCLPPKKLPIKSPRAYKPATAPSQKSSTTRPSQHVPRAPHQRHHSSILSPTSPKAFTKGGDLLSPPTTSATSDFLDNRLLRLIATSPSKNLKTRLFLTNNGGASAGGVQSAQPASVRPLSHVGHAAPLMAGTSSVAMERVEEPCDMHNVESVNVDLKTGRVSQIESEEEGGGAQEDSVAQDSIQEQ